jgi:hypothetical protein
MKLLMVIASDETSKLLSLYIKPLGFNLIRYRYVLKAMDNLDEIEPDAVIMSARDFPRHWQILLQFVRCTFPLTPLPFVVLRSACFPFEDAVRAFYLGATPLDEQLSRPADIEILRRVVLNEEPKRISIMERNNKKRFSLMLVNPLTGIMVAGEVKGISDEYVSFLPAISLSEVPPNTELPECSLRAGEWVLSPRCLLTRQGREVVLRFLSFPGDEGAILSSYLRDNG